MNDSQMIYNLPLCNIYFLLHMYIVQNKRINTKKSTTLLYVGQFEPIGCLGLLFIRFIKVTQEPYVKGDFAG